MGGSGFGATLSWMTLERRADAPASRQEEDWRPGLRLLRRLLEARLIERVGLDGVGTRTTANRYRAFSKARELLLIRPLCRVVGVHHSEYPQS